MSDQPTVALLGTGTMGEGMARNIAAAGLPLRVWNRTASRPSRWRTSPRSPASVAEAVRGADVVVTMLYDADSVAESMEQARGELGPETVWLQQSTVGVEGSERLAALAADLGVTYVDAPVLGTKKPARTARSSCWPPARAARARGSTRCSTRSAAGPSGSARPAPAPG